MADLTKDQMHELGRGIRYDITAVELARRLIQQRDSRSEALLAAQATLLELVHCDACQSCGATNCSEGDDHKTSCPIVARIWEIEQVLCG